MTLRLRTSLLRRIVMVVAGVALFLSVSSWIVSLWGVSLYTDFGFDPSFVYGNLFLSESSGSLQPTVDGFQLQPAWVWWPQTLRMFGVTFTVVPLWLPTSLSGCLFLITWLPGQKRRRFQRAGRCPSCGYDLAGIDGMCPECGTRR